jgi:hypothetical protein
MLLTSPKRELAQLERETGFITPKIDHLRIHTPKLIFPYFFNELHQSRGTTLVMRVALSIAPVHWQDTDEKETELRTESDIVLERVQRGKALR